MAVWHPSACPQVAQWANHAFGWQTCPAQGCCCQGEQVLSIPQSPQRAQRTNLASWCLDRFINLNIAGHTPVLHNLRLHLLCYVMPCRSLGDMTAATVGCTSDPEITYLTLRPHMDCYMVLASDGVWDVLTNDQVRVQLATVQPWQPEAACSTASRWAVHDNVAPRRHHVCIATKSRLLTLSLGVRDCRGVARPPHCVSARLGRCTV